MKNPNEAEGEAMKIPGRIKLKYRSVQFKRIGTRMGREISPPDFHCSETDKDGSDDLGIVQYETGFGWDFNPQDNVGLKPRMLRDIADFIEQLEILTAARTKR